MGCNTSRGSDLLEEKILDSLEKKLGFRKITCLSVDLNFRKYSTKGTVTAPQWIAIINALHLNIKNTRTLSNKEEFYEYFRSPQGNYNFKRLLCLGIVLSEGIEKMKARLLFQV